MRKKRQCETPMFLPPKAFLFKWNMKALYDTNSTLPCVWSVHALFHDQWLMWSNPNNPTNFKWQTYNELCLGSLKPSTCSTPFPPSCLWVKICDMARALTDPHGKPQWWGLGQRMQRLYPYISTMPLHHICTSSARSKTFFRLPIQMWKKYNEISIRRNGFGFVVMRRIGPLWHAT